jgi:hypothetical protein
VLAVLDHRQFGRAFVLSIGEAGHEATTAPVSSGAGWRSPASGARRRRAAQRLPIGRAVAWSGSRGAGNPRLPLAWPVLAALDHRQFGRAFVLSIGEAGHEATTAPGSSGAGWRSPASGPGEGETAHRLPIRVPWPGQALGVRAIRGCRWRGPCWQRSTIGSSVGPSFSRSVKPATKRRRRQRRAVLGGDRRQVGQVEGETAYRLPIGRAVAWSGSRGAGNPRLPLAWPVLAALDHRQFGRSFVLSIGEAGHEATTAPGGDRRQVGQGEARQRTGCRSGLPWRGQALGVLAGIGCRRAPGLPPAWFVLAVLDHRQFGRAFVLSIGEAGHEATTAPVSSGAGWRSPASGPGRRRDSVPAADRGCRGVGRISGCLQCSIAGSSVGPSSSRLVKPATKRRRRLVAIAGKWCQGERGTAHRLPIGVAVAWSGYRAACRHRLQTCARVAAGVVRAGSARPSAVRSGLRSLDR